VISDTPSDGNRASAYYYSARNRLQMTPGRLDAKLGYQAYGHRMRRSGIGTQPVAIVANFTLSAPLVD
jgi:hypothetical protein